MNENATETTGNQQVQKYVPPPIPIERIWVPEKPNAKVLEAVRRLKSWPTVVEALFPGIAFAVPEFSERLIAEGDDHFDPLKELPVGIGAGRFGNQVPCVVTAVTQYLGIKENEALKGMREGIQAIGPGQRMSPTELQKILETLHRGVSRIMMYNLGMTMLHYIQVGLSNQVVSQDQSQEDSLETIFEKLVVTEQAKPEGGFKNEKATKRIRDLVKISMRRLKKSCYELSFIAQSMIRDEDMKNRTEKAKAKAEGRKATPTVREHRKFIESVLLYTYKDEVLFWQGVADAKATEPHEILFQARAHHGGGESRLKAVVIETDNPLIVRASRHKEAGSAQLTMVKNRDGNVGIYKDPNSWKVSLFALFRIIVCYELMRKGVKAKDIDWLGIIPADRKPGEVIIHEQVKHWRLTDNSILNTGRSMIQATELRDAQLLEALQHGFHPWAIAKWRNKHGIEIPEKINTVGDAFAEARKTAEAAQTAEATKAA